jgi:hypothetical protein
MRVAGIVLARDRKVYIRKHLWTILCPSLAELRGSNEYAEGYLSFSIFNAIDTSYNSLNWK